MRVLRSVFAVVFFVLGVFVASANIHDVELIYLPAVEQADTWGHSSPALTLLHRFSERGPDKGGRATR